MGEFYRGTGYFRDLLGICEGGDIYRGTGLYRERIGSYRNGTVYDIHGDKVGSFDDGWVRGVPTWNSSAETLGYYKDGTIYEGVTFGTSVGSYDEGSDGGAEAAAYLLLMREGVSSGAVEPPGSSADVPTSDSGSGTPAISGGGSGAGGGTGSGGGSGAGSAFLGVFVGLLLVFSFGLIWWAIFHATRAEDMPYLIILVASIMLGLFLGLAVFKAHSLIGLYVATVVIASAITVVACFITNTSGYSFLVLIIVPPIVVALASAIPTALTYLSVSLIRMAVAKRKKHQNKNTAQPAGGASSAEQS
jgi:hypothetical protein